MGGSGTLLVGGPGSNIIATPQIPYLYRVEVEARKGTSAAERAKYSVLYAY